MEYNVPPTPVTHPTFYARRTNGFAIASLVLSLVGFSVIAIIFGHIALGQIKRNPNESGRGMALAGNIIGYLSIVLFTILIIVAVSAANNVPDYQYQQFDCSDYPYLEGCQ
jgi:peptidoglycan biosynthesis protein MviN/MurJ (putative lipid II flippase)